MGPIQKADKAKLDLLTEMARPMPPEVSPSDRLAYLLGFLKTVDFIDAGWRQNGVDDCRRVVAVSALDIVIEFVKSFGGDGAVLKNIARSLAELSKGNVLPLVSCDRPENRPRAPSRDIGVRALAAASLQCLMDEGTGKQRAAKDVARELAQCPRRFQVGGAAVIKWREEATCAVPDPDLESFYSLALAGVRMNASPSKTALTLMASMAAAAN